MGAGILPVAKHNGKNLFLLGQENFDKKWSDFGGSPSPKSEPVFQTAIREGYEETDGFFGSKSDLKILVENNFITKLSNKDNTYHSFLFKMKYDENLPTYFNNHHKFIKTNFSDKVDKNGFFEKSKMKWYTVTDLKDGLEKSKFRHFYRGIIKQLINISI